MDKFLHFLASLFWPHRCLICRGIIKKGPLCDECEELYNKLPPRYRITEPAKMKKMTVFAAYEYDEGYKTSVEQYKFNSAWRKADDFAELIIRNAEKLDKIKDYDIICSVPMTKEKVKARGYNQSVLIAEKIAEKCGLKFEEILVKPKNNRVQHDLDRENRLENVKGVYTLLDNTDIKGKRILVVDDIITTGATITECGAVLYGAGAEKVTGLCAASVS